MQVSKIRLGVTFSMVVVLLATGGICSWHFYQLSVVVPLLKSRRQRLPLQHAQPGAPHHHHAQQAGQHLHGVIDAAVAANSRSPKRRSGAGGVAADG